MSPITGMSRRDMRLITFAGAVSVSIMVIAFQADGSSAPQDTRAIVGTTTPPVIYSPITQAPATTAITVEQSTTSTEPVSVPPTEAPVPLVGPDTPCQEWIPLAVQQGWPADRDILETLASVMYRESRCQPTVVNPTSPDHGLLQVNEIHRAYVEQLYGMPFEEAMADPARNLNFAWHLYSELEAQGRCGWEPWSLRCA